jgi:hypothetical protein
MISVSLALMLAFGLQELVLTVDVVEYLVLDPVLLCERMIVEDSHQPKNLGQLMQISAAVADAI